MSKNYIIDNFTSYFGLDTTIGVPQETGQLAEQRRHRLLLLDGGHPGRVADGRLRREVGAVVAEVLLHQRQHHLEEELDRLLRLLVARTPAGARFNSVRS